MEVKVSDLVNENSSKVYSKKVINLSQVVGVYDSHS